MSGKNTIVSISQPTLFPWLGYFNIIKKSDVFVFLDTVKFEKRSWQMRNRLKLVTSNEEKEVWVRIPTKLECSDTPIRSVSIDNSQNWQEQHLNTFQSLYGNNYRDINFLVQMYEKKWEKLAEFNIEFITKCCQYFDIKTKLVKASDYSFDGNKSKLLLNICKHFSATEYLSTIGSKDYLERDKNIFELQNIKISYHQYEHPRYSQRGKIFIKNLSVLDLLFNEKNDSKSNI